MKKYLLLFILCMSFILCGCQNKNDLDMIIEKNTAMNILMQHDNVSIKFISNVAKEWNYQNYISLDTAVSIGTDISEVFSKNITCTFEGDDMNVILDGTDRGLEKTARNNISLVGYPYEKIISRDEQDGKIFLTTKLNSKRSYESGKDSIFNLIPYVDGDYIRWTYVYDKETYFLYEIDEMLYDKNDNIKANLVTAIYEYDVDEPDVLIKARSEYDKIYNLPSNKRKMIALELDADTDQKVIITAYNYKDKNIDVFYDDELYDIYDDRQFTKLHNFDEDSNEDVIVYAIRKK
ncbi:MAG: hypothetical protein MJ245_01060 [Clostridia bacterium]|nr:hypothetical protein [Clostridia bacterium]